MKTFSYLFFLIVFATAANAEAQKRFASTDGISRDAFGDKFSVFFDKNNARNFYAVDMDSFQDEAAYKYFQQQVFKDDQLVSVSVPENGIWYLSTSSAHASSDILSKLDQMKTDAYGFSLTLTTEKRNAFLSENKK